MSEIVCAHCGSAATGRRRGFPWCPTCGIYLVPDNLTDEWISIAEREHRRRVAHNDRIIRASQLSVLAGLPTARRRIPPGWHVTVGQVLPGAIHTLDLHPPAGPAQVHACLSPPWPDHGWTVRIHNRSRGVGFPLYTGGGVRAAEYPTVEAALDAAVAALRAELADLSAAAGTPPAAF